jgi:hypothetical protein
MDERGADVRARPLARSLDPLPEESLGGYLLRLACRLRVAPLRLARMTGCVSTPRTSLSRRLLLDLEIDDFTRITRLTRDEAVSLTFRGWAQHYPPIARSLSPEAKRTDSWLFNQTPRFCPRCLVGDGTALQQQYGGPWKKQWHLPVSFACLGHQVLLHDGCPHNHPAGRWTEPLISQSADDTLHPAQCRHPRTGTSGRRGVTRPSCGTRLDDLAFASLDPIPDMIETQRRILEHLDPSRSGKAATRFFSDLRLITTLLSVAWPLDRHLIEPAMHTAVDEHVRNLGSPNYRTVDTPPNNTAAAAALLTAAARVLDDDGRQTALVQQLRVSRTGRASREPWVGVFARHAASCSPSLRHAIEPFTRTFQRTGGSHSARAPVRTIGYRAEHIPAFIPENWYERHFTPLAGLNPMFIRRTVSLRLVQTVAGGSLGEAAGYLGIADADGTWQGKGRIYSGAGQVHTAAKAQPDPLTFEAGLQALAAELDASATHLVNYQHRREALQAWTINEDDWRELLARLPPIPGPTRPDLGDRKRQLASIYVWTRVTSGEHHFAPRPIEAAQPPEVRNAWTLRRNTIWSLMRNHPGPHYTALRAQLDTLAEALSRTIDKTAPCDGQR